MKYMKDTKTLNLLKAVTMILLLMLLSGIIVLWFKNNCSPYYIVDKGRIADKVILAGKMILMIFLLYKSTAARKYLVTLLVFIQTAGIFWLRFMGPDVIEAEYMKIDRLSLTICCIAVAGALLLDLFIWQREDVSFLWVFVSTMGWMGMALSYDLVWLDFSMAIAAFGLYMWMQDGKYWFLGIEMIVEILLTISAVMSAVKLETMSLQAVIVCKAMGMEGAVYAAAPMAAAGILLTLFGGYVFFSIRKEMDTGVQMYLAGIVPVIAGIYLCVRFVPVYSESIIGDVVKFSGAVILMIMACYINRIKQWKQAVCALSIALVSETMSILGSGIPLTTWFGIMLLLLSVPLLMTLYINEETGKYFYVHLVVSICMILLPVEMAAYRMSAFKMYLKMENKIWIGIMGIAYIALVVGIMRWTYRYKQKQDESSKGSRTALYMSVMLLAAIIIFMPYITKNWIYPMLSQTEVMIANLSVSKIPVKEMVVTGIMAAVTFLCPAIVGMGLKKKDN